MYFAPAKMLLSERPLSAFIASLFPGFFIAKFMISAASLGFTKLSATFLPIAPFIAAICMSPPWPGLSASNGFAAILVPSLNISGLFVARPLA